MKDVLTGVTYFGMDTPTLIGARTSRQYHSVLNAPKVVRGSAGHFYCTLKTIPIPIDLARESLEVSNSSESGLIWKTRPRNHFSSDRQWKSFNSRLSGKLAGSLQVPKKGPPRYAVRLFDKIYLASRLVYALSNNLDPSKMEVDHIDGNPRNNNPKNLRLATRLQNVCNRGTRKDNKSGYTGVQWSNWNQKWLARLRFNGKSIDIGYFDNPIEAKIARDCAGKRHHGEFYRI